MFLVTCSVDVLSSGTEGRHGDGYYNIYDSKLPNIRDNLYKTHKMKPFEPLQNNLHVNNHYFFRGELQKAAGLVFCFQTSANTASTTTIISSKGLVITVHLVY